MSRRAVRGVLAVIGGLMVASGAVRIGDGTGAALARDAAATATAAEEAPLCESAEDVDALLAAFEGREARIERRETQVADRLQALSVAEAEIDRKLVELRQAEEALAETLALAETASESDLDRLVAVYESMKPADAAALFEEMAPDFAAGFVGRMEPQAAAAILAGLEPTTAYSISVVLAGRNARVPTE